ncbi:MAG: DUF6261 family protein [Dysgonamonadaceae bacterium]|jgi:hypothetical protein|nr:DUF6261 family protein [Dysgonamonadaceae bacterium]
MKHLIVVIDLYGLKNETHAEFNENVNRIFIKYKYNLQALSIQALYDRYQTAFSHELEALDYIRGSEITKKILRQDHERNTIYRGLVDTVSAALRHFNPDLRGAARLIENVVKHYGNISKKTFDNETSAIDNLLRELQSPEIASAANQIGLTPWKDKLAQENMLFKQLMMERYVETAGKTSYRMKTVRVETDRYYHAIVNQLENNALAGIAVNEAFVKELNAVIERFKHILAKESGERKPKNENEETG